MMARCEFINDLIPLIFESHNHWWPRDLLALATVSPCWLIYARKRLYSHPIIHSFSTSTLLARTLTENPSLMSLIRGITLRPMKTRDLARRLEGNALSSLRYLLALEGLNHVTLGGELAVKAGRFLKLIAVADVVYELHIDGSLLRHRLSCPPSLEWDESIACQFPNLKKLRLTRVELSISSPSIQFPLAISSLQLEDVNITHGFLLHLLNGTRSLEQFHVSTKDAAVYDEQIQIVLESCAVGCLHYEVEEESHGNAFILDGDTCSTKTLRCLHLRGLFVDLGLVSEISMIYRNLAELVVCGREVKVGANEWARLIGSGGFESVRRLGLPWGNWRNEEVEKVRSACADAHRSPRKSSSFLSLRRENTKAVNTNTSPSSYFDFYPKKSRTRRPSTSHDSPPTPRANSSTYAFPTFEPMELISSAQPPLIHNQYTRTRSRTGPSAKSQWDIISSAPQLRFSASSSTQNTETPPRTPDDLMASMDFLDNFPVVVAAPVAGVETMDALVDGMNGGDMISRISNRSRFRIPGHHPLYQPPLPTPPPGVVLGGGKARPKPLLPSNASGDSSDDDGYRSLPNPTSRIRRRVRRPDSARTTSNSTITPQRGSQISGDETTSQSNTVRSNSRDISRPNDNRKSVVPSISEIIRNHAPPDCQARSRPSTIRSSSLYSPSTQGHATLHEEVESEPEPLTREEEAEFLSRSSIDSVADEVQRTIRNQGLPKPAPPASAFTRRHSVLSDSVSIYSPRSDPGAGSIYSLSAPSSYISNSPFDTVNHNNMVKPTPSQAVAQYLRSARLTTLLKLTRSPHASQDNPLTVSLSDLGCPTGIPVIVFLGLGCVRHIMGLYDEMADCMGLRLITIDRWGLGRTEPRSKSAKGIMQWASVVEEVLDLLHIDQCSIMAHSAGAPYALSFANKLPSRIRGDVCLLAPWVGGSESSGYKWLKYVPNSILKTAQAAEWKIQAWMIGKPPTIAYEGIGYNAPLPTKTITTQGRSSPPGRLSNGNLGVVYPSNGEPRRPSIGSSSFSEYDDLGDFEGRFESRSTLGMSHPSSQRGIGENTLVNKRKASRGILERLKGSPSLPPQPQQDKPPSSSTKKLKGLRSMSSLRGKTTRKADPPSPQLPPALRIDIGLGLEDLSWTRSIEVDRTISTAVPQRAGVGPLPRSSGRRSISFGSSKAATSIPSSPSPSTFTTFFPQGAPRNHHVALGNALIAASHSESSKGTHNDLLQILNHENHSWGFSYSSYPHKVRVWYGDKDERIAENAVRWMERTMGTDRCSVKVVKGADHGLMYRSSAVVDVLEWILSGWRTEERFSQPYAGLR